MFCENCGCENPNDAAFCQNCGSRLNFGDPPEQAPVNGQMGADDPFGAPSYGMPDDGPYGAGDGSGFDDGFDSGGNRGYDGGFTGENGMSYDPIHVQRVERSKKTKPKEKRKLTKKAKAGIIAGCVLVVAVLAFVVAGRMVTSPERIVRQYMDALIQSDWDRAYSYVNVTESAFINKDNYIKMCESSGNYSQINNFEVTEMPAVYANDSSEYSSSLTKTFQISYTTSEGSGLQTMEVSLIRQSGNTWLFFPSWKVSITTLTDYTLYIPAGATATLDGVALGDDYKNSSNSDEYYDCYKISTLFQGSHELHMEADYCDPVDVQLDVQTSGSSYTADNLSYSQETINSLVENASQMIQAVYGAALQSQDYSTVQNYFSSDAQIQTSMRRRFESIQDDFIREDGSGVMSITCSNVTGWESYSQSQQIEIEMDYDFTSEYTHYTGYGSSRKLETETESGSDSLYVTYTLENGEWKISDTSIDAPYYFY